MISHIAKPRFLAFFFVEGGLIVGLLYALANVTLMLAPEIGGAEFPPILLLATVFILLLFLTQAGTLREHGSWRRELVLFTVTSLVTGLLCVGALWLMSLEFKRLPTLLALEGTFAVPVFVGLLRWASVRFRVLNAKRESVLIVGTGETARQVCRWIGDRAAYEYAVLGFADEDDHRLGTLLAMGVRIQTDYENIARFGERVDRVIVALDEKRGKLPLRQLMELRLRGVEIEDATSFFERASGKIAVETMLPSWLIFSDGFKSSTLRRGLKRTADIFHAVLLLVAASPVMLLTALAIKLDSRGPVFYRQKRLGMHGVEFEVMKFRSMHRDAEKQSGPTWAQQDDPRVTRVGRLIRKLRIDELPQLFNVLKGQMSFVGPRPERAHFVRQLEETIPYYGLRMTARPGITGWAQVEYHYGASEEDALEKLKYDLYYIKNSNLLFDLWIVLKTCKVVLVGAGAR